MQATMPATSNGHICFVQHANGIEEYFAYDGAVWHADAARPITGNGVRYGRWETHNTPAHIDMMLKALATYKGIEIIKP